MNWVGKGAESDTELSARGVEQIRGGNGDTYDIFWYAETYLDCQRRCAEVKQKKYFKFMPNNPGGVYGTYLSFSMAKYCWCYDKVDFSKTSHHLNLNGITSGETRVKCDGGTGGMP